MPVFNGFRHYLFYLRNNFHEIIKKSDWDGWILCSLRSLSSSRFVGCHLTFTTWCLTCTTRSKSPKIKRPCWLSMPCATSWACLPPAPILGSTAGTMTISGTSSVILSVLYCVVLGAIVPHWPPPFPFPGRRPGKRLCSVPTPALMECMAVGREEQASLTEKTNVRRLRARTTTTICLIWSTASQWRRCKWTNWPAKLKWRTRLASNLPSNPVTCSEMLPSVNSKRRRFLQTHCLPLFFFF